MSKSNVNESKKKSGVKRREFLKILGVSGAAVGAAGCSPENAGKLIPYLVSPDETVPGVSTYYATTCRECAASVRCHRRDARRSDDQARGQSGSSAEPRRASAHAASRRSRRSTTRIACATPLVKKNGAWKPIAGTTPSRW